MESSCVTQPAARNQFADHSVLIVGGFGQTQNSFISTDLDSGKTEKEKKLFGSLGVFYRLPIIAKGLFALNAHLGVVYNFAGGDKKELSKEFLNTHLDYTRIYRIDSVSVSNLSFLDLPRVGLQFGIEKFYVEPSIGFGVGWNDPRLKWEQTDVKEERFYDSKIGHYWKVTERNTEIVAVGGGESDVGFYGTFALGIGSRLSDLFGLYAEVNKRVGYIDSWGGLFGVSLYFDNPFK